MTRSMYIIVGILFILLVTNSACTLMPSSTPSSTSLVFPTQQASPDPQSYGAVELIGQLRIDDNSCLRVEVDDISYFVIWPYGFTYKNVDDTIIIVDHQGNDRAHSGQQVKLGGAPVDASPEAWQTTQALQQPIPTQCPPPYWLGAPDITVVE